MSSDKKGYFGNYVVEDHTLRNLSEEDLYNAIPSQFASTASAAIYSTGIVSPDYTHITERAYSYQKNKYFFYYDPDLLRDCESIEDML